MLNFCLPAKLSDEFLKRVKSGELNPEKLTQMTSKQRRKYLASFLGDFNAQKVNTMFEGQVLLKNQQRGLINWAKRLSGMTPLQKRDFIDRVNKMETILQPEDMNMFLEDLVAQRLGVTVTPQEASRITDLAREVSDRKAQIPEGSPVGSQERIEYGTALTLFKDYVGDLKTKAKELTPAEFLTSPTKVITSLAGTFKSILASMDNSFFGRQGFVTLVSHPDIWGKNFVKSWGDMKKEIQGVDAISPIKADIFSRPNALNGKYKAIGLDVGITSEEAFPSALPERVPIIGRVYKATESAYNGAALRFRADIADRIIAEAETQGLDVYDKSLGIGLLVNSMTGRGKITMTPEQGKFINVTVFSIKYLKSNIDVLTAHTFDKGISPFVRKKALNNLLRTVGVMAGILAMSKAFDPDSVELDPRSTDFGKLKFGNVRINISLGLGSLITLASRITPTLHRGKWGFWVKTNKKRFIRLGTGKYGVKDPIDVIVDFMEGKASPVAGLLRDYWKGRTFDGKEFTVKEGAKNIMTPIPISNLADLLNNPEGVEPLSFMIYEALDILGVNVNVRKKRR